MITMWRARGWSGRSGSTPTACRSRSARIRDDHARGSLTMARMSSEWTSLKVRSSNSTSLPPYAERRTRSPGLTSGGWRCPSLSRVPGPTDRTRPCVGFSFAVSGMTMPLAVVVFSSTGSIKTRSPIGLRCGLMSGLSALVIHDFGFHHVALRLAIVRGPRLRLRLRLLRASGLGPFRGGAIKFARDGLPGLVQARGGGLDGRRVAAGQCVLHGVYCGLDLLAVLGGDFVGIVAEHLFGTIDDGVGLVARFDFLALAFVLLRVRFGIALHAGDLVLGEPAAGGDGDLLLATGAEVLGVDVQDAVGIDVEADLDLRHAARGGRNLGKLELADGLVVARQRTFTLEHVDFDARLIIGGG